MIKKLKNIMLMVMALLLLLAPASLAQEDEKIAENTIGPGNPFYGLDVFFDRQRMRNAPPGIDRARIATEVANERLEELRSLDREDLIAIAREHREEALKNVEEEKEKLTVDEKQEIETKLQRNTEVLQKVIARFQSDDNPNNDNAIPALQTAVTRSEQRLRTISNTMAAEITAKEIDKIEAIEKQTDARKLTTFQFGRR